MCPYSTTGEHASVGTGVGVQPVTWGAVSKTGSNLKKTKTEGAIVKKRFAVLEFLLFNLFSSLVFGHLTVLWDHCMQSFKSLNPCTSLDSSRGFVFVFLCFCFVFDHTHAQW